MRSRVLVLEGDKRVRAALERALEHDGTEVIVAADGRDALARLRSGATPSVALVDLDRRRLGGASFVERVRADPRFDDLPIITTSGGGRRQVNVEDVVGLVRSLLPGA
jgi:chemosensory pili system protein ChpA (sensor histidine kinase/response regulator)